MDNPGWRARRRAGKEAQQYAALGRAYNPLENVGPMDESAIGGVHPGLPPPHSPRAPPVPPKNANYLGPTIGIPQSPSSPDYFQKYQQTPSHPHTQPPPLSQSPTTQTSFSMDGRSTVTAETLTRLSAVERSQVLRVARMEPHIQFMCGPLLRFDTIDSQGIWHGAALIVTMDSGSIYEPYPNLTYEWDPDRLTPSTLQSPANGTHSAPSQSHSPTTFRNGPPKRQGTVDLGPHPADPHSTTMAAASINNVFSQSIVDPGPNASREVSEGQELYVYGTTGGTFTFWRFLIKIPLGEEEMEVTYRINNGQALSFFVPGRHQNMRWAAHSCNGFSAGVNPDDFRGPGFQSGYDPVWVDLLTKHAEQPFHALVGGGDQLYCDVLLREFEMQEWASRSKPEDRKLYELTDTIKQCIDRFFFNHYCESFRRGAFARANCSIPMINMCDDHDLIDGFGSYPHDMQQAPVFQHIGSRGYFFFLIFQCFINPDIDGLEDVPGRHVYQSLILGQMGPYIPFPSHSFLCSMGPQTAILMMDCRSERMKDRICSPFEYEKIFQRLEGLNPNIEHLVVQVGIPIAYPRMVFLETALESKLNPLVALGRNGSMGLAGFVNKFNADAELLDDLTDHWTARSHKKERNWLIEQFQKFAKDHRIRVTFLSGDVHCAAVGLLKTLKQKNNPETAPLTDHRYMLNVVTSAIVNTPPPAGVLTLVNQLSSKTHKTMHYAETDETMVPLFTSDTNGNPRKQKYVMGRRNWCSVDWDAKTGNLVLTLQVEKQKGLGVTVPYVVSSPPPCWARE